MQEKWDFYLDAAKHTQELNIEEDVRCKTHGSSPHLVPLSEAPLEEGRNAYTPCWNESTRSTLPTVEEEEEEEEEACDAFLVKVWQHPDFELCADNDRT
eukprot:1004925-Amphidinium_carterae.2